MVVLPYFLCKLFCKEPIKKKHFFSSRKLSNPIIKCHTCEQAKTAKQRKSFISTNKQLVDQILSVREDRCKMLRPKTRAELSILGVNNRWNEIRFERESDDHHILIIYWNIEKGFFKNTKEYVHFLLVSVRVMLIFNLVQMSTTERKINAL